VNIHEDKLGSVCATLTTAQRSCSYVEGACQCSALLERSPELSGTYGVLDNVVVIGSSPAQQFVDYCVQGELLHWQEQGTPQQLLLRRESVPAPGEDRVDPVR
jgi:hypothetical protein